MFEHGVGIVQEDVAARGQIVGDPVDGDLLERVLHQETPVQIQRLAQRSLALLPEALAISVDNRVKISSSGRSFGTHPFQWASL
jgi:hypothetical protein